MISPAPTRTLLVTGGAGFIGSNFVRCALRDATTRVVVFDKLGYSGNRESLDDVSRDPRFELIVGDIADASALSAALERVAPTSVVHLAAESHVDRSIDGPRAFVQTNIVGTFELLEAVRVYLASRDELTRDAFRFLHVSTDEVYGSLGPSGAFTESSPYAPNSPYAASKASSDHLVRAYGETYGLPVIVTACSNNYGPYQYPEKLIPLTILNALAGEALPVYGDGSNVRDWLFVEDHCEALLRVLARGERRQKYNIGGACERRNVDVVHAVCDALEAIRPAAQNGALRKKGVGSYRDLVAFVTDRPGHDARYAIDASKIRNALGWHPETSFEEGLQRTVRWYVENAEWCDAVDRNHSARRRAGLGGRQ